MAIEIETINKRYGIELPVGIKLPILIESKLGRLYLIVEKSEYGPEYATVAVLQGANEHGPHLISNFSLKYCRILSPDEKITIWNKS